MKYVTAGVLVVLVVFLGVNGYLSFKFLTGKSSAQIANNRLLENTLALPQVSGVSILPLVDFEAAREGLKTEPGLSYLVRVEGESVLFDVGYNKGREEVSPLLHNMEELGVALEDITSAAISHNHVDHVGGLNSRNQVIELGKGEVDMHGLRIYTPVDMKCTGAEAVTVAGPMMITGHIGTTGPLVAQLYVSGAVREQSLLVNLRDKGLVLISGCGHPQIIKMVEAAQKITGERVYAVVGGFHLYYTKPNGGTLPVIFGSNRLFARKPDKKDVEETILELRSLGVQKVHLSPHDADEPTMEMFHEHFGADYGRVAIGQTIEL